MIQKSLLFKNKYSTKEELQAKSIGDGAYEISPIAGISYDDVSIYCAACCFNSNNAPSIGEFHLRLSLGSCSSLEKGCNAIYRLAEETEGQPLKQVGAKIAKNSRN